MNNTANEETVSSSQENNNIFINTLPFSRISVDLLITTALTVKNMNFHPIISKKGYRDQERIKDVIKNINKYGAYCIHDYTYMFVEVRKGFGESNRVCPNVETPIGIGAWMHAHCINGSNSSKSLVLTQHSSEAMKSGSIVSGDNKTFQYDNISIVAHPPSFSPDPSTPSNASKDQITITITAIENWLAKLPGDGQSAAKKISNNTDFVKCVETYINEYSNEILDNLSNFDGLIDQSTKTLFNTVSSTS